MNLVQIPRNEDSRLAELYRFAILDTSRELVFDRLVRKVVTLLSVDVAMISLMDRNRQWFKARRGIADIQTARDVSFCAYAVCSTETMVVEDALDDPRFANSPLVTKQNGYRFYVGVPLVTQSNLAIGTLCVLHQMPRSISAHELQILRGLGRAVMGQITLRSALRKINAAYSDEAQHTRGRLQRPAEAAATEAAFGELAAGVWTHH